jgi:hypothetical protein
MGYITAVPVLQVAPKGHPFGTLPDLLVEVDIDNKEPLGWFGIARLRAELIGGTSVSFVVRLTRQDGGSEA